jgi:hypothetical protein
MKNGRCKKIDLIQPDKQKSPKNEKKIFPFTNAFTNNALFVK